MSAKNHVPFLSVVIPFYNEEAEARKLIEEWSHTLKEFPLHYQILAVDDGSKDKTLSILQELTREEPGLQIIKQQNSGHGAAILNGYTQALEMWPIENHWILQIDSDRQVTPDDFAQFWVTRETAELVTGVRKSRQDPLLRRLFSKILAFLLSLFFMTRIYDPNVPYRLINASFLFDIIPLIPRTTFAPNILLTSFAAKKRQLMQIPVQHFPRRTGEGSISFKNLIAVSLKCLFQTLFFCAKITTKGLVCEKR